MEQVITLFQNYMGTGLMVGWCLLSVVWLLWWEKRKPLRIMFVYVPLLLLLIFFNPLFARFFYSVVGEEIYYRILWLIPATVIIAYAAVQLYGTLEGKKRILMAGITAVLIMISGKFIYLDGNFSKAENLYHVPQSVVEICDAIEVEGREVMAVFPEELIQYVRQYSPVVCMPYGRDLLVDSWGNYNELHEVMEAEAIDAERLAELAKESLCHYIILPETKEIEGDLLDYDYVVFDVIQGYVIYLDTTMYLGL